MQARAIWSPPTGVLGRLCKQAEIRAAQLRPRLAELRATARDADRPPSFAHSLAGRDTVQVIAEIKRSSPSKGVIDSSLSGPERATAYVAAGAAAISVLTEPNSFGGSLEDLLSVVGTVAVPVLKKDFHIDEAQVWEARVAGASALLLIARALGPDGTEKLSAVAAEAGIETLVEVRDGLELDWAVQAGARIIGVNRRDLETLALDDAVPRRVLPLIPSTCIAIAESGISDKAGVSDAAAHGADAVLVGSSLSESSDPTGTLHALLGVPRRKRPHHG